MKTRKHNKVDYNDSGEEENIDVITPSTDSSDDYTDPSDEVVILSPVAVTKPLPPFHTVRNVDAIYAYLCERVKDQPALFNVAATVSAAINRSFMTDEAENRPAKLLLSGVSGCGKTETVLAIQALLGIGPTTADCEAQVVFLDGSTLCSESQVNAITGAAAGLVGYRDGHSIADRLNRAINKPCTGTRKQKPTTFEQQVAIANATIHGRKKKATTDVVPYVPPRFIMLVIDELDKVSLDLLKAINGLIETGDYATPNNSVCFKKPLETTMFIIFTSNYGEAAISGMKVRDDELAESFIIEDMRLCGVPPYTIGRLGDFFPFYPLTDDALHSLLGERLDAHIQQTPLAKKISRPVDVTLTVKTILIQHILSKVHHDMGVRGAMKQLLRRVDLLFEKAFAVLSSGAVVFANDHVLQVTGHRFNVRHFEEEAAAEDDNIIHSIKNNPANTQTIALCRGNKTTDDAYIEAMGISIGDQVLCHFVLPPSSSSSSINKPVLIDDESVILKEKLSKVSQLLSGVTDKKNSLVILRQIKEIVQGDEEEEEEQDDAVSLKRKSDTQESSITVKKPRLSKTNRKCRARVIEGFTCGSYSPTTKRYYYICNACNQSIDPRFITSHHCAI